MEALHRLNAKVNAKWSRTRTRDSIVKLAEKAVSAAGRYITYTVTEKEDTAYRQAWPGRPSNSTKYRKVAGRRFVIDPEPIGGNIEFDARCDGIFPPTNCTGLSAATVLEYYKFQPRLEKRHEQLKSVYAVMPMLFKKITRIESILFLYYVAMLIQSLIEREARLSMKREKVKSVPIYHESRECRFPTADRLLHCFDGVQIHHLSNRKNETHTFQPQLSPLQKQMLDLMGVNPSDYSMPAAE